MSSINSFNLSIVQETLQKPMVILIQVAEDPRNSVNSHISVMISNGQEVSLAGVEANLLSLSEPQRRRAVIIKLQGLDRLVLGLD